VGYISRWAVIRFDVGVMLIITANGIKLFLPSKKCDRTGTGFDDLSCWDEATQEEVKVRPFSRRMLDERKVLIDEEQAAVTLIIFTLVMVSGSIGHRSLNESMLSCQVKRPYITL